jgi:hypothetical protein
MPTVNYGESLRKIHAALIAEWEEADEKTRGSEPVLGLVEELEHVNVTYPDANEWRMEHEARWFEGWNDPEAKTEADRATYAAINLCDSFEGIKLADISNMPLHYTQFFGWLRTEVLTKYYEARLVPNGSTPSPQTTQRGSRRKPRSGSAKRGNAKGGGSPG